MTQETWYLIRMASLEGRNVMPLATDEEAHAIEVFAARLLASEERSTDARLA